MQALSERQHDGVTRSVLIATNVGASLLWKMEYPECSLPAPH